MTRNLCRAGRRKRDTARRGFRAVLGAAAALLVSCRLIPEIEGEYPAARIPERSGGEKSLFDNRRERETGGGQAAPGEQVAADGPAEEPSDDQAAPDGQADDAALPDVEFELAAPDELAEADYPEKAPEERSLQPPPVPAPLVPLAQSPPIQQPAPPPQSPSPPPPPVPPPQLPPPAPPPRPQRPPPPPPPPTARPSRPVPPPRPAREEPLVPPSDMPELPFQPAVSVPPVPPEPDLDYSRTVKALVGQYIEIPFRGPGWVYLGEFGSRRGVSYDSRRMEDEGMTFVFRADEEGTYSLKFDRQDFVRDYILNDYVKVIVEPPPVTAGSAWSNPRSFPERVYAEPRWPQALDSEGRAAAGQPPSAPAQPAAAVSGRPPDAAMPQSGADGRFGTGQPGIPPEDAGAPAENAEASGTDPAAAVPVTAEDWLGKAREEYNAGRIAGALGALDQFMLRFPGGSDEAFWLYGQSYEANNEATRDIRQALDYYRRLTREYPQSTRYDDTRRRIAYLERFYFNIQ